MYGYINYPNYPKEFQAKRKFFSKVPNYKINEFIQKGVRDIILEHELGRGKDRMECVYLHENVEIKITYDKGKFHAYVKDNEDTHEASIDSNIKFDYANDEEQREWKIREAILDEFSMMERNKIKESKRSDNVLLGLSLSSLASVVLFAMMYIFSR